MIEQLPPNYNEMIERIIKLNEAIVRQNTLIVQTLMLPQMMIFKDDKEL